MGALLKNVRDWNRITPDVLVTFLEHHTMEQYLEYHGSELRVG